jgi:O-antigen ligase
VYGRLVTAEDTLAEHLRFAYLFTDPNTAGYFLLVAAAGLLMTARTLRSQLTTLAILAPLVFITQSRGALFIYALVAIATIYPPRRLARTLLSVRRAGIVLFVVVGLVCLLIYLKQSGNEQFEVARMAYERLFEASSEQYATGGARLYVWERFFTSHLPLPLGRGYVLDVAGVVQGTHTDVLRITYSYGLIALVAIMMFFFRRLMSFPVLILPALMAFLINSLIDEQKLMALFLALLGICIGSEERLKETTAGAPHAQ